VAIVTTADLAAAGFDVDTVLAAGQDIRAYYEEAGLALSDHVPAARQLETWFYRHTRTGQVVRAAAKALETAGAERNAWYFLLPGNQHG
jgi:hypothetical protein